MTTTITIDEYVKELIEEIGNLPTSAGGHRAYQLAQYLPAVIEFVKLKGQLTLASFTLSLDRHTHVELDLSGLAELPAKSAELTPIDAVAKLPTKRPTKVTTTVITEKPTTAPRKRKPRTDEQRAKEAASMRRRRATKAAEREKAKE